MIYIGHFFFDGYDQTGSEACGHFTCLAEADSVEVAVKKFRDHICELRDSQVLFEGGVSIFLDDIVEIQKVPEKAVAIDFISSCGEEPSSLGGSIPPEDVEGCSVYDWLPDGENEGDEDEIKPFLQFDYPVDGKDKKAGKMRHLRVIK